ncbi:hypothetical protein OG453_44420 [Streptomyces sp. NBC_01381]|uniref:hypothetical protein n=1 Tax=Streptomyces sp. NBC_01381 TaxID=2903845 RepID=UPI00224D2D17|nr:hypothetical protein [Streptomyces sp. NBC_01381]MCX4673604.1 hypothetical protein [Streptomyces sp. NBC_01381]
MSTEFPAIDRDKSPLADADRDAVRIAEALRHSPRIVAADGYPGDDVVTFTTVSGMGFSLTLHDAEPTEDDLLPEPVLTEALAAAILNHPAFVTADADSPREDTITVQTRNGIRYLLALGVHGDANDQEESSTPAADIALAADRLLASDPLDSERATAELLNYVAATWEKQDVPLRQHAQAVARSLTF